MATALPFVMAGLTVLQAYGESRAIRAQGKHDRDVAYANAKVAEGDGDNAFVAAASRAREADREGALLESSALARGAGAGISSSEMFVNQLAQIGSMTRFNAEGEIYGGHLQRNAKLHEASLLRWQGDAARQQAKAKAKGVMLGGIIKGMGHLYGGLKTGGGDTGGGTPGGGAPVSRAAGMGDSAGRYSSGADKYMALSRGKTYTVGKNGMLVGGA